MIRDSAARRLLVITYHFPPDGAVGGLRWSGLSKYLARAGWEVHIVTAANQAGRVHEPGVVVHEVPRRQTLNDVYKAWVERRRANGGSSESAPSASPSKPDGGVQPERLTSRIRRTLGAAIAFPDYARGWTLRAAARAQALQGDMSFDAVISSGPPHSAHIAGVLGCVGRHATYIIDMRDPWSPLGESGASALNTSRWFWAITTRLERIAFARARRVIANNSEFAKLLREYHPGLTISYVSNGIDPERLPGPAPRYDELTISYLGTLYLERDLTPVIRAMREFVALHPEARDSLRLRVAGYMDVEHAEKFWSELDAAGLRDRVDVKNSVPGAEALNITNRSHLTLVLAQNQPKQIPAKLYECVAMGVPTLVIGESDSAAAREARRIGAMVCEADDVAGIRKLIEHVWRNPAEANPPRAAIGYDGIAMQMDAVIRASIAGSTVSQLANANS